MSTSSAASPVLERVAPLPVLASSSSPSGGAGSLGGAESLSEPLLGGSSSPSGAIETSKSPAFFQTHRKSFTLMPRGEQNQMQSLLVFRYNFLWLALRNSCALASLAACLERSRLPFLYLFQWTKIGANYLIYSQILFCQKEDNCLQQ